MWQKCPACDGNGSTAINKWSMNVYYVKCTVCDGKKIISVISGKPPIDKDDSEEKITEHYVGDIIPSPFTVS